MLKKVKQVLNYPVFKFKINWSLLRFKEYLKIFLLALTIVLVMILIDTSINFQALTEEDESMNSDEQAMEDYGAEYAAPEQQNKNCNVVGIELHGYIATYISNDAKNDQGENAQDMVASDMIMGLIRGAEEDAKIKAIILEIDSSGGNPVAAEELAEALKRAKKPTVSLIRTMGLSAAYWAATGGDTIFASANSDVGSIGVTMSYVDNAKKNQKDGLTYNSLRAGKFKDAGDPNKPLTEEERALYMRDVNLLNENFIKAVAENRKLDIAKVRQLADGSSVTGSNALEKGLIDKTGTIYDVKDYLKEKLGEDVEICWY